MGNLETNGIFADHFLLKEQLTAGNLVETWLAEDWRTAGRLVSIRLYAPSIRLDQHTLELLMKELEARATLKHPHLAIPNSFGVFEGIPYEVLPFSLNNTLQHRQTQAGPLSEHQIALYISQMADALHYLHKQQPPVYHRQLSTGSIYLQEDGVYQLSAPALSQKLRSALHKATNMPLTIDTAYAAPELFGQYPAYSDSSDIFALGVCLYELCTGQLPWLGNGGISLSQGADVPVVPAPYSGILNNLIRACLHADPNKRPSTTILAEESDYYLTHGNWKPYGAFGDVTAQSIVYKRRSPLLWLIPLLLVLLAGAAGAYYYYFMRQPATTDEPIPQVSTTVPDSTPGTITDSVTVSPPVTTAVSPPPAAEAPKPAAEQTAKKPVVKPAPAASSAKPSTAAIRPAFPRPTSLGGYFNGLLNEEIPFPVREQWRSAIRAYFTPDAIIYAQMNGAPLGSFGVSEFIDILLSTEEGNSIVIDKTIRNEESNTIEEINVSIITVK